MKIPTTKNHRQLARWINAQRLGYAGDPVAARVESAYTNTDRKLAGTRLRRFSCPKSAAWHSCNCDTRGAGACPIHEPCNCDYAARAEQVRRLALWRQLAEE